MELSIFTKTSRLRTLSKVGAIKSRAASIIAIVKKKPLKDFAKPLMMPNISPSAIITKNAISAYGISAQSKLTDIFAPCVLWVTPARASVSAHKL